MPSDFPGAFTALRQILQKNAAGMVVQTDTPTHFIVITRAIGPNKKPLWFGAAMIQKSAVTFHLVPLYFNPVLQSAVPQELLARKQGKTCFNFQRPDKALFAKLESLTKRARATWESSGFLEPGPVPQERFDAALRAAGEDPGALEQRRAKVGKAAAAKRAATVRKKKSRAATA